MPNKDGVWKVLLKSLGRIKDGSSTMFPTNWSEQKILEKILEAYSNAESVVSDLGDFVIVGKTNCGVSIKILVNSVGKLRTAYPLIG